MEGRDGGEGWMEGREEWRRGREGWREGREGRGGRDGGDIVHSRPHNDVQ